MAFNWSDKDRKNYSKHLEEAIGKPVYEAIPHIQKQSLLDYIISGCPTGSFLQAVLSNDLVKAVNRGDDNNQRTLHLYAKFLYNHAPTGCWGSEESYDRWKARKGIVGVFAEQGENL